VKKAIIARLIDIRKAQIEYKNKYKVHAASFEELSRFLKEEKIPSLKKKVCLQMSSLKRV
jgi:hypothetical protein